MPEIARGWGAGRVLLLVAGLLVLCGVHAPAARAATPLTAGVVRFTPPDGVAIEVGEHRYDGTIEIRPAPGGGMTVIDELGIESYVAGVDEMPSRWPAAALEAQAIAARTYAWYQARLQTFTRRGLAYDVCATTACQRFRGRAAVEQSLVGQRWQDAVDATVGEVLLDDGAPILARYFSSSGGHTRNNEDVFGGAPLPYLRGVDDPGDAVSPYHHWTVRFTRAQFDAILAHGEQLAAATPVADARRVVTDGVPDRVRVTGTDGTVVEVGASAFRTFVSTVAPQLYPDAFPGPGDNGARLPTTLPSSRIDIRVSPDAVVIEGGGYGHGVGMSQWGAMGMATDGADAGAILAHYYHGLTATRPADLPATIRVGWDAGRDAVTIHADQPLQIQADGDTVTTRGMGPWTVAPQQGGRLGLQPPAGYGASLQVAPTTVSRAAPSRIEVVTLRTTVNKPSQLRMDITRPDGSVVLDRDLGIVTAGTQTARWSLDDADGRPVAPGPYAARLVAVDETGASGGQPASLDVQPIHVPDAPAASLLAPAQAPWWPPMGTAALGGLLAGVLLGALLPGGPESR